MLEQFAHTPVSLNDSVATRTHCRGTHKAAVRSTRHVRLMESVVEEERLALVFAHEILHLVHEIVRHVLVHPTGLFSATHKADTGNAVDDGLVMSVRPLHFQHFRIGQRRRFALKILFIAHFDRVVRVKAHHIAVFHINRRHTVVRGGNQTGVVEAYLSRTRFDSLVPVNVAVAHTQMPFADGSRRVAAFLHHPRQCELRFLNEQRSVARQDFRLLVLPRILSRQQPVAAGGRCGGSGIAVCEAHASVCQTVDVRRTDSSRAIGTHIAETEVVGKNYNHVRFFSGECQPRQAAEGRHAPKDFFHCHFVLYCWIK